MKPSSSSALHHVTKRLAVRPAQTAAARSYRFPSRVDVLPDVLAANTAIIAARGTSACVGSYGACPLATQFNIEAAELFRHAVGVDEQYSWHAEGAAVPTASIDEGLLLALGAAKARCVKLQTAASVRRLGQAGIDSRSLVVYCHPQQVAAVSRVAMLAGVGVVRPMMSPYDHQLQNYSVLVKELAVRVEEDTARGFTPLAVVGTYGTSSTAAVDPFPDLKGLCRHYKLWLHADASEGWASGLADGGTFGAHISGADSITLDASRRLGFAPLGHAVTWFADRETCAGATSTAEVLPAPALSADDVGSDFPPTFELKRFTLASAPCLGASNNALHWVGLSLAVGVEYWAAAVHRNARAASDLTRLLKADGRFNVVSSSLDVCTFRHLQAVDAATYLSEVRARGFDLSPTYDHDSNVLYAACVAGTEQHDVPGLAAAICDAATALRN